MRKYIYIIIIIIACIYVSCNSRVFYYPMTCFGKNYYNIGQKEGGMPRPYNPHFWLARNPYQLKAEDNIDTNAIYINKDMYFTHKGEPYVVYLRFFANGRCAFGFLFQDSLQYNAPSTQWNAGYYKMHNPNKVELELFVANSKTVADYQERMGIIKGDTIYVFFRYNRNKTPIPPTNYKKWTREKDNNCYMYIKRKVDTLTGRPDW